MGWILQDKNSRTMEERTWALPRLKIRDHIFLILEVRRPLPNYTCIGILLGGQKGSDTKFP